MSRRIIDIHNHPSWNWHTTDVLVANMDELGIERTWLLSWELPKGEIDVELYSYESLDPRGVGIPLWQVVDGLQKYPERFIGGWAPDPRDRTARGRLYAAVRMHGIRVYGELKCRMRYDDPDAIAMFQYCSELHLPVLFHLQGVECAPEAPERISKSPFDWPSWYGGDISVVENMCRLCPQTQFIGHGPGFWRAISGDADQVRGAYPEGPVVTGGRLAEVLRKHENLHCDLSAGSGLNALNRDLEHAKGFVEEFQDRIMFGRDSFDLDQLALLEKLQLSDQTMEKILHVNGENLIKDVGKGGAGPATTTSEDLIKNAEDLAKNKDKGA